LEARVADDKAKRGAPDRTRINIHEPYEVAFWAMKWNVTEKQLKAAVSQVGPMVMDVAKALGQKVRRRTRWTP
jgi:Protein of unknown function (DUF3606)